MGSRPDWDAFNRRKRAAALRPMLWIAIAGFVATSGVTALAQATINPPTIKPVEAKPSETKPSELKPSDLPAMTFFVAKGEANACGPGCDTWIAADGKIDLAAPQRLRALLARLGRRKLPIFFNSAGGAVLGAIALGRIIRSEKIEASVARTVPTGCNHDKLRDAACEALMRSGQELASELDPMVTWCNSGCVLSLSGGAVRSVPPWVKLGVHAIGIDLGKTVIRGAPIAAAIRITNERIVSYLHDMGINKALFDASDAVPHESSRYLQRDELVRFGIDTRSFGETPWRFMEKQIAITKGFFSRTGAQVLAYPNALLKLSCGTGQSMRLTLIRENIPNLPLGAALHPLRLDVNGLRVDLPYGTSANMETRAVPLLANVADSLDDKAVIGVVGFDPDANNQPQSPTIIHMDGYSAAYAKFRKACDQSAGHENRCEAGDLSPRCMAESMRTSPAVPSIAGTDQHSDRSDQNAQ
jgi:hypothetical protein